MNKEEILSDFVDISLEIKKDLIDTISFDLLTLEGCISQLISMCDITKTSRYDLIDYIKESMVEILFDSEIYDRDKDLRETLDKDVDLIQIEQLVSRMDLKNKKLILFKVSEQYPDLMMLINSRANFESNGLMADCLVTICKGSNEV